MKIIERKENEIIHEYSSFQEHLMYSEIMTQEEWEIIKMDQLRITYSK
jgi:hypothetical protein